MLVAELDSLINYGPLLVLWLDTETFILQPLPGKSMAKTDDVSTLSDGQHS